MRTLYTVGHSSHSSEHLLELLRAAGIRVLVDVRTAPYSRRQPQFSKPHLQASCRRAGITYRYAGAHLGGRPHEPEMYDPDGHVRYDLLAATPRFREGVAHLLDIARRRRTAILCAEEDPHGCHRRILIGRAVAEEGMEVIHLRGDGRQQREEDLDAQLTLFDGWRSVAPVRRPD